MTEVPLASVVPMVLLVPLVPVVLLALLVMTEPRLVEKQTADWLKLTTLGEMVIHFNWNAVLDRNSVSGYC